MKITQINHQFNGVLKPRRVTQRIIVHHSASHGNEEAATIHRWHLLDRGWAGIGYHFVIRRSGEIQTGRPLEMIGAHAGAKGNWDSVGVCLVGHFNQELPTRAQLESLAWLVKYLEDKYGRLEVIGHRDVMPTDCPGSKFPWEELRAMVRGGGQGAQDDVKLTVNGRPVQVPLRIVDGHTEALLDGSWVQLRALAEMLQAEIGWDKETRTVNFVIK